MKSLYLRSSVALACALSLSACGGGNGTLVLGGAVYGLTKDGLVLQNSGKTLQVAANSPSFQFPDLLGNDVGFDITVQTQPTKAHCDVTNGKGTTGSFNPINIVVSCVTDSYDLKGTVSGLDTDGLVIINGANRQVVNAGATSFTMTHLNTDGTYSNGRVADGAPYGLTVLTQPAGRTCSVLNGVGTMTETTANVQIQCAPATGTN